MTSMGGAAVLGGGVMGAMTDYDAIIIGGGHNGLVAAAYLAQAGQSVLVLERRDMVGGACVTEELFPGYRVSSCAYICHLLQAKVIDDLRLREPRLCGLSARTGALPAVPRRQCARVLG